MLSRRWLFNGLLILVIATLATLGYHLDPASDPEPAPAIAARNADTVEHIEIHTAIEHLTLHKQESGWALLEPLRWPADRAGISRLIGITDIGGARPLEASGPDLARLGFENPIARLQLDHTRVSFGIANNIGERRYTMIDSTLFLLPDLHLPFIQQGLTGFVDRRLLPPRFKLTALSLPGLALRRGGDGNWQTSGRGNIDPRDLAALVADWQGLAATRVGDYENPAAPLGRIVAELDDGRKIEFLLLSVDPEIVIANPGLGLQYHFRRDLHDRLILPSEDETPA